MARISAAGNLIIEAQPESWRLLVDGNESERVLVEAVPGEPLRYVSSFGSRRHLPESGILATDAIQRVVLGWSEDDTAWHLGLVLRGDLVTQRGSRWCGLAHWLDPLANQYQQMAVQAGQTLAKQVARPFTFIPPHGTMASAQPPDLTGSAAVYETPEQQTIEPTAEPIPQPELPLKFDLWTLKQTAPARIELELSPAWGRSKLLRVAWNIVWLGAFIILTLTTLTSGIALPRPEFLVYLGFASIAVLVLVILIGLFETLTHINRIIFDQSGVRWLRGKRVRRTIPIERIQEVYISLVVARATKRPDRAVHHGEINLFLKDGKFQLVLTQEHTDDKIPVTDDPLNEEAIASLSDYNARTRLQSAALYMAHTLGVPAEYDKRMR